MKPIESNGRGHGPWYREPMVWLVLGLPLASILAGLVMIVVATRAGTVRDELPGALKAPRGPVIEAPRDGEPGR